MVPPRLLHFSHGRNSISFPRFPNSHGIISFADPHLLNPVPSYRYEKHGGRGVALNIQTCKCAVCIPDGVTGPSNLSTPTILLTRLAATLAKMPISVDSKRLTGMLSSLDATLTKNRGYPIKPKPFLFHQHPVTGFDTCPEDVHPPYYWSPRTLPANFPRATFPSFLRVSGFVLTNLDLK
jgi:hypothetical protein